MTRHIFGLRRDARFINDLDYTFIDVDGRVFRLEAEKFKALRDACLRGLSPSEHAEVKALVAPCASRDLADRTFRDQELDRLWELDRPC